MSKFFAVIAVLFCICLAVLAATDPYTDQNAIDKNPYQLMKVRIETANGSSVNIDGQTFPYAADIMVNYNKITGTISPVRFEGISPEEDDTLIVQNLDSQPFQIVPNANGGCFVMNPTTGKTWLIDQNGNAQLALTDE